VIQLQVIFQTNVQVVSFSRKHAVCFWREAHTSVCNIVSDLIADHYGVTKQSALLKNKQTNKFVTTITRSEMTDYLSTNVCHAETVMCRIGAKPEIAMKQLRQHTITTNNK
jgi:hypothetical protein